MALVRSALMMSNFLCNIQVRTLTFCKQRSQSSTVENLWCLKERPHMFQNVGFKTKIGKRKVKNVGLDMCLSSRSLVLRLVPFLLATNVCFQL